LEAQRHELRVLMLRNFLRKGANLPKKDGQCKISELEMMKTKALL